jgi:hypothetical protein
MHTELVHRLLAATCKWSSPDRLEHLTNNRPLAPTQSWFQKLGFVTQANERPGSALEQQLMVKIM